MNSLLDFVAGVFSATAAACAAPGVSDEFDHLYAETVAEHYPPSIRDNWCIAKAICEIESRQRPDATSPAGAVGLCQVEPHVADSLRKQGRWDGELTDPADNILAHALIFTENWQIWTTDRSDECRLELTLASYNAGARNVIRAQHAAHEARCWEAIGDHLPAITGHHATETQHYVARFWATYRHLRGYGL